MNGRKCQPKFHGEPRGEEDRKALEWRLETGERHSVYRGEVLDGLVDG